MTAPLAIEALSLTQFRSYAALEMRPDPGINCLTGPNGVGKTNILDALHFLALTRGFRSSQDAQAIRQAEAFAFIHARATRHGQVQELQCNLVAGQGKRLILNGAALKPAEYIGRFPLVAVLPTDTDLVNEAAEARRKFMDVLLCQCDAQYLAALARYKHALAQRNALLKQAANTTPDWDLLQPYEAMMTAHGMYIARARQAFLRDFAPLFARFFAEIVSETEQPALAYAPQVPGNTQADWAAAFRAHLRRELALGRTETGIHRDDLACTINGISVRHFGSQGQQKTYILAMRLAEYALLEARTGLPPLLLLDDAFDKLDEHRLRRIAALLRAQISGQMFITDPSAARLRAAFGTGGPGGEVAFWDVAPGTVLRQG